MAIDIRLVYESAEDMANAFKAGAKELEGTRREMEAIAATLEDGALLGRGGQMFVEAIKGRLSPSLQRLIEKFEELDGDVRKAIDLMVTADRKAEGKFR